jgi:hypothetical protein
MKLRLLHGALLLIHLFVHSHWKVLITWLEDLQLYLHSSFVHVGSTCPMSVVVSTVQNAFPVVQGCVEALALRTGLRIVFQPQTWEFLLALHPDGFI